MKKIIALLFLFCAGYAYPATIWVDRNLYSSSSSLNVGDVIIVNVNDISSLKYNINLGSKNSNDITSNPDMTITGFLPKISGNRKSASSDSTQFSGSGSLKISVAATVAAKTANGMYTVAGVRVYSFNGVASTITVAGVLDPALIKGRIISSDNLANFRIEIRSASEGINIQRQPKEGEAVKAELSEAEKQKVVVDYLQRVIRELTK